MTKSQGVWKHEDAALILIDYQKEMFDTVRSETPAELIDLNTRLLIKAAKAFDMPIVLSTVGVEMGVNHPTRQSILEALASRRKTQAVEQRAF
jgi:nicotinamidase-related amidase